MANAQDKMGFSGLFGSYHMSSLPNDDDKNVDFRMDYVTTFRWGAGIEKATWFNQNFGMGFQGSYWNTGQDYKGVLDTSVANRTTYTASTTLTYGKLGVYLYHKSFNRYKPNARFKFLSYFGPYAAYRISFSDKYTLSDKLGKIIAQTNWVDEGVQNNLDKDKIFSKFREPKYKQYDLGFTIAPGFQFMITPRIGIGLNLRADLSGTNVENQKNIRLQTNVAPYESPYNPWVGLDGKYATAYTAQDVYDTRPATININYGASLSLRFYTTQQYEKDFRR